MRGLYAIIDADFLEGAGVSLLPFAEAVVSARPAIVQLRAKSLAPRPTLELLRALRPICAGAGVPLFANDRPDLAVLSQCDGVHVGQDDLDIGDVRRFAPSLAVGVSTHDLRQLEGALSAKPDYVAYGPVFRTSSKANPDAVVGLPGLREASDRTGRVGVPLVAIGGIDPERIGDVAASAELVAVIRALLPPEGLAGVRARVEELAVAVLATPLRRS